MESFWILGAGRFGSLAVQRIVEQKGESRLLVVDHDARALKELKDEPIQVIEQDAIDFLANHPGLGSEWIVPAIPMHVAFTWLCRELSEEGEVMTLPVPAKVDHQVPNPLRDKTGALYTSFASFRCPDNCDEPPERCPVTGEPREANLFDIIRDVTVEGYVTRVLRSHQLTPGVGGYRLSVLWALLEGVRSTEKNVLVATACRCHGVIDALHWEGNKA